MKSNPSTNISRQSAKVKMLGRFAWTMWSIGMAAQFLNTINRVAATPAVDQIMADFGMTAATWGGLMSMYFYIYAIMQIPSGIMADYLGPRKNITIGCAISTLGTVIFSWAPSIPMLFLGRFFISLGVALIYVNLLRITVDWFKSRHFARMVGLAGFVSTLGSLVGTSPMALLITAAGWRWSFEILAIINLGICIACWVIIRNKPADKQLPSPEQVEYGLEAVPDMEKTPGSGFSLGENLKSVLSSRHVWATFMVGAGLLGTMLIFVGAWGIPYLMQTYGLPRHTSADFMSLILISHAAGIMIIPFISDRIARRKLPIMVCAFCYLAVFLVLTFWNGGKPPLAAMYPIFILMGAFTGTATLAYVVAKENMPSSKSGIVLGVVNMSAFITAAIFQMLVGLVLDANWQGDAVGGARVYPLIGYQYSFFLILIPVAAAVIGSLLMRETRCKDVDKN